jgi:hypothetical protein
MGFLVTLHRRKSGWGVKLIVELHVAQKLTMSGAIPLLPQFVFIASVGTMLHKRSLFTSASLCINVNAYKLKCKNLVFIFWL